MPNIMYRHGQQCAPCTARNIRIESTFKTVKFEQFGRNKEWNETKSYFGQIFQIAHNTEFTQTKSRNFCLLLLHQVHRTTREKKKIHNNYMIKKRVSSVVCNKHKNRLCVRKIVLKTLSAMHAH